LRLDPLREPSDRPAERPERFDAIVHQEIVALLAITNPLGAVPVFLAITGVMASHDRSRAAMRAAVAVVVILGIVAIAGKTLLATFGISMPALQAAGGLVVLLMGLEMLHGKPTKVQHDEEPESRQNNS
jgi:multiple antibiotic resistance protein